MRWYTWTSAHTPRWQCQATDDQTGENTEQVKLPDSTSGNWSWNSHFTDYLHGSLKVKSVLGSHSTYGDSPERKESTKPQTLYRDVCRFVAVKDWQPQVHQFGFGLSLSPSGSSVGISSLRMMIFGSNGLLNFKALLGRSLRWHLLKGVMGCMKAPSQSLESVIYCSRSMLGLGSCSRCGSQALAYPLLLLLWCHVPWGLAERETMPALCPDDSRTVCQIKLFFTSTLFQVFHFTNQKQVAG